MTGQIGQAAYSGLEGGIVGNDLADRARTGAIRHPRADDRAGPVHDAAAGQPAAGGAEDSLAAAIRSRAGSARPTRFASLALHMTTTPI